MGKRYVGFTGPCRAECAPDPIEHLVLLRRQGAPDRYAGSGKAAQGFMRRRQVI